MLFVVAQEVVVKAGSPWITIGAAGLAALIAGLIACIGWYVVHQTSRSRDLLNWRRTTVLQSVSDFIATVYHTDTQFMTNLQNGEPKNKDELWAYAIQTKALKSKVEMIGASAVYEKMQAIALHQGKYVTETIEFVPDDHRVDELNEMIRDLMTTTRDHLSENRIRLLAINPL